MLARPTARIAVASPQAPVVAQHRALGVIWCRTVPELIVLARTGRLQAIVIDRDLRGLGLDLVASLRPWCTVLVVDPRPVRPGWEAAGAAVLTDVPADPAALVAAIAGARRDAAPRSITDAAADRAALVTVVDAPDGGGASAAAVLARSIAATDPGSGAGSVVLADLTLDGLHRRVHGLSADEIGLPELIGACRFGLPPADEVDAALHRVAPGVRLLPGLRDHHDWVSVGGRAARVGLDAVRARASVVVAHVDRDLEGEADTGSFDIEDRNVLARTAVRAADLVVVSSRAGPAGHMGLLATLASVAGFGVPRDRVLALATGSAQMIRRNRRAGLLGSDRLVHHVEGRRVEPRIGRAVRARLAALGTDAAALGAAGAPEPERIVPGVLGHWAHDIEGWITPRVPQQP